MKVTLTRYREWWQFWVNSDPVVLSMGKDYVVKYGVVKFAKTPRDKDKIELEY